MFKNLFHHVGDTKIIPISFKLLIIFVSLLLLSNFATNFINLQLSKKQLIDLNNSIMVGHLKDIYSTAGNQYQIYSFTGDKNSSINAIKLAAIRGFEFKNSIALAFSKDGKILFTTEEADDSDDGQEENSHLKHFQDENALEFINKKFEEGISDGSLLFNTKLGQYYGVYKYQSDWNCYIVRAELRSDTMKNNAKILGIISLIILILISGFLYAGLFMFRKILFSVDRITGQLYEMQQKQKLSLLDLSNSPNDDITYLAASFNSLSSTINNLINIFQKFASKDVVAKAYKEHEIRLEGKQRDLVMLFSDIRSFTYRTETLGNDIIDLLNVHYDKVIKKVHENSGVIGSIIGDAILAIYGTGRTKNKSLDALEAAWQITRVTALLRQKMIERRTEIEKTRPLTETEEKIYQAVLIDIGVGIDGGKVFYGNIGSDEHMTNTVIGDNVNSASRLEGLTRIYQLPVIVSEYIKNEIEEAGIQKYKFYEIDTVQVKGKTEGKKIYFPMTVNEDSADEISGQPYIDGGKELSDKFEIYENALEAYYKGDWSTARKKFMECKIEAANVFIERIKNKQAPADWSGIWTMTTK